MMWQQNCRVLIMTHGIEPLNFIEFFRPTSTLFNVSDSLCANSNLLWFCNKQREVARLLERLCESSHVRVTSVKSQNEEWLTQASGTDKASKWSDLVLIKTNINNIFFVLFLHQQHFFCFVPASTTCLLFCSDINNMFFVLFWHQQHGFCLIRHQQHGFCFLPMSTIWLSKLTTADMGMRGCVMFGRVAWFFTRQGHVT